MIVSIEHHFDICILSAFKHFGSDAANWGSVGWEHKYVLRGQDFSSLKSVSSTILHLVECRGNVRCVESLYNFRN